MNIEISKEKFDNVYEHNKIYQSNKIYNVVQIILNNVKMDSDFNTFIIKQKILISNCTLYNSYKNIIYKSIPIYLLEIYKFILKLGFYLENYYIKINCIKSLIANYNKYRIILTVNIKNNFNFIQRKIEIFPWRTTIQTILKTIDYYPNIYINKKINIRYKFYSAINSLLFSEFENIRNINVHTNMKDFINKFKLFYKLI